MTDRISSHLNDYFNDHMLTDDAICDCDECQQHGWHGNKVPRQSKSIYRNTMDSCLLLLGRHNSNCGTMNFFELIEEEWNHDETEILYARVLFSIRWQWIYHLILNKRRRNATSS